MNRFLLWICLTLASLLATGPAHALDQVSPSHDHDALVLWVQDNATGPMSTAKAASIVKYAYKYAFKHEMDPLLVLSVLRVESGYRDKVVSSYGARGMSQVVPRWHRDKLKGRPLTNTAVAIEVGTQVLKDCSDKHRGNRFKTLGCYSGGGGKRYHNKVMVQLKSMRKNIIEARVSPQRLLYAAYTEK